MCTYFQRQLAETFCLQSSVGERSILFARQNNFVVNIMLKPIMRPVLSLHSNIRLKFTVGQEKVTFLLLSLGDIFKVFPLLETFELPGMYAELKTNDK